MSSHIKTGPTCDINSFLEKYSKEQGKMILDSVTKFFSDPEIEEALESRDYNLVLEKGEGLEHDLGGPVGCTAMDLALFLISEEDPEGIDTLTNFYGNHTIPSYLFSSIDFIEDITLGKDIIEIEQGAFDECPFDTMIIEGKLEYIGSDAFYQPIGLSTDSSTIKFTNMTEEEFNKLLDDQQYEGSDVFGRHSTINIEFKV